MADAKGIAAKRLQSFIERIERLEDEKREVSDQIKEVKSEAKSAGFDVKIITTILKRRRLTAEERDEQDALLDTYEHAIGQLAGTPLGDASDPGVKRARDDLKSSIDNLTKEPGASISLTTGGVTTTLKNVDGTRILEQTGEPTTDMGPAPTTSVVPPDARA